MQVPRRIVGAASAIRFACIVAAAIGAARLAHADVAAPRLIPSPPQPMSATGGFGFASKPEKHRLSVSGIACAKDNVCVLAFDEGVEARTAMLSTDAFVAEGTPVPLSDGSGEVDAEGVATDGSDFFVIGSHSRKRGECEVANDKSRTLVRLPVGPDGQPGKRAASVDLAAVFQRFEPLKAADGQCLTDGAGLNIEGVAASGNRLWFGFRGPTSGPEAFILSVDAKAIFTSQDAGPTLYRATVGDGRAIRDMQAVAGGLMLLVGPDDDEANEGQPYGLVFWRFADRSSTKLADFELGSLDRRKLADCKDNKAAKVKPEALRVVERDGEPWKVAILSDGLCDGGPLWFDAARP